MIKKEAVKKRILKTKDYRKGIRLVVYKKEKNKILYLILKRKLRWIGYETPKGGKLNSEPDISAIKRELKEETSLKPKKIIPLNIKEKFTYPKQHQKLFNKKGMI
jgi:8-oxo-dGTP pyrophosphatase MutT (NUDIX family)